MSHSLLASIASDRKSAICDCICLCLTVSVSCWGGAPCWGQGPGEVGAPDASRACLEWGFYTQSWGQGNSGDLHLLSRSWGPGRSSAGRWESPLSLTTPARSRYSVSLTWEKSVKEKQVRTQMPQTGCSYQNLVGFPG